MQKVYLMSEYGTMFYPATGEHCPIDEAGRITAVCALRPEDVVGEYGYLAVVERSIGATGKTLDEARQDKPVEPIDPPFIREAVMIVNRRNMHVVN
jgi:hypothetical protein